jgi:hypothetical protein
MRVVKALLPLLAMAVLVLSGTVVLPTFASNARTAGSAPTDGRGLVSFGEDVVIDADVAGDVQVVFGSVRVDGRIDGDLLVFGGNVELGSQAEVTGEIVTYGGTVSGAGARSHPGLAEQAGVSLARMNDPRSPIGYALKLSFLVVWLVAAVVLSMTSGRELRASSIELRVAPFHAFGLGLVAFTSFILTALVFAYLLSFVIGLPLLAALAVFALMTKIYGMIVVFHAVGSIIAAPRTRDALQKRRWVRGDMGLVLVGLLVLGLVRMIPLIGNLVWIAASLFGVGVALATKFGRREPWFLMRTLEPRLNDR